MVMEGEPLRLSWDKRTPPANILRSGVLVLGIGGWVERLEKPLRVLYQPGLDGETGEG